MKTQLIAITLLFSTSLFAQNQMLVPPALEANTLQLTLQNGTHQFYNGVTTNTMGVNGNLLGPTLIMDQGDHMNVTFDNQLGETTTIHWHGMHVSADNDGGPHTMIDAGSTWNPQFTVLDKAATYWYHPHLHEHTNEQVQKGIAGFVIVRDNEEAVLTLPRTYGEDDFPIVFQTKAFNTSGQIDVDTQMDTAVLANGTINAHLNLPAQVVRLRLLNGASQRVFKIARSSGASFKQIATDGGLLAAPVQLTEILLAPGERAEILLDLTGMQGQNFSIINKGSGIANNTYGGATVQMGPSTIAGYANNPRNGTDFTLLNITVVAPTANPVTSIPSSLVPVVPYLEANADVTRNLTLSPQTMGMTGMVNGPFVINNASFDMNVINQTVQLNDIEIWSIFNQTGISHPFHIHDVQFYILDVNGTPPPANQQGRKDVVLVPNQQTVRFITKFEDFSDSVTPYMYHCHMLTHEDDGMMGQFVVIGDPSGINENASNLEAMIYPNPVIAGLLNIASKSLQIEHLELYNLEGKLVYSKQISQTPTQVDLSHLSGTFLARLIGADGQELSKSIIINHN